MKNKEQQLIDIMFEVALTINNNIDWFQNKSDEDVCAWVRRQLNLCGFDVVPIGSSWGVLRNE